jgi:hypothetical protein
MFVPSLNCLLLCLLLFPSLLFQLFLVSSSATNLTKDTPIVKAFIKRNPTLFYFEIRGSTFVDIPQENKFRAGEQIILTATQDSTDQFLNGDSLQGPYDAIAKLSTIEEFRSTNLLDFFQTLAVVLVLGALAYLLSKDVNDMCIQPLLSISTLIRPFISAHSVELAR